MRRTCMLCVPLLAVLGAPAQTVRSTITTMGMPSSIAVNPVTNKIYLTNPATGSLTSINGIADRANQTLVGTSPVAVAVNATTDRVYVSNAGDTTVSVLDGTFAGALDKPVATVNVQGNPGVIAVNPATNKIYVAIPSANRVAVIDGLTNSVAFVPTGALPTAIATNPATNKIYVVNTGGNSVTVIDGATNGTATVPAGTLPAAIGVNIATNRIYVTTQLGPITIIDGTNDSPITITGIKNGSVVAVNPITNKIYVGGGGAVAILDGATNSITSMATPFTTRTVALNATTNQIYVAGLAGAAANPRINLLVIDGATNNVTALGTTDNTTLMAVNPATNRIYLAANATTNVTDIDGAVNRIVTIPLDHVAGSAVDPLTKRVYAISSTARTVSVVDAATNAVLTAVPIAAKPLQIALNPITSKVYVLSADNTVTVIDEATLGTSIVPVGNQGGGASNTVHSIVVDAAANRIYVANFAANTMSVIDGATNTTATVSTGTGPASLDVNPVTNRIYVANAGSGDVTVVDGQAIAVLQTVAAGGQPRAVAVNPNTNQIFVASAGIANLLVIDGATNGTSTIPLGGSPDDVIVDPLTGRAFVAVPTLGIVIVDAQTAGTFAIPMSGSFPFDLALNQATHKVYSIDLQTGMVNIVDGLTGTVSSVPGGAIPIHLSVNPATSSVYVSSRTALLALSEATPQPNLLTSAVTPLTLNETDNASPQFPVTSNGGYGAPVQGTYYHVDDRISGWIPATVTGPGQLTARLASLTPGLHTLYTFATDGQDSTSANTAAQSSPLIGSIAATLFLVLPPGTPMLQSVSITPSLTTVVIGYPIQLSAIGTFSDGTMRIISGEVSWSNSNAAAAVSDQTGVITGMAPGSTAFTASFGPLRGSAGVTAVAPSFAVIAAPSGPAGVSGQNYTINVKVTNSGNVPASGVALTGALLNSTPALPSRPTIGLLAPGASSTFSFTFPGTAGAGGAIASLRITGSYNITLPGGATQTETFTSGGRLTLP